MNSQASNLLSVIILTYNEEKHLPRCLASASRISNAIFVVDSFSSDRTVEIATASGAVVFQRRFKNHADQLTWAIKTLPFPSNWIMRIDADEIITSELAANILNEVESAPNGINGFRVLRYIKFQGSLIQHGNFPQWNLRIWRRGTATVEQRWMDEHIVLLDGISKRIAGKFIDDNLNSISWWIDKHNGYASREAIDLLNKKYRFLPTGQGDEHAPIGQTRLKAWLKETVYVQMPRGIRAILYFLFRLLIQGGILDGRAGIPFHLLQGFWYRYLVDMKVAEVERTIKNSEMTCVDAILEKLGIDVRASINPNSD